ncbi:unnamed protein product [Moneuplotes crassus]|uniref:Uncharacterized protein n=1 Tax=Euplotes crassus TaxID=5936 RepID=A0AAD1U5U1_EUPCR|nr:unnamed protein product [Moneuplotes crassus]
MTKSHWELPYDNTATTTNSIQQTFNTSFTNKTKIKDRKTRLDRDYSQASEASTLNLFSGANFSKNKYSNICSTNISLDCGKDISIGKVNFKKKINKKLSLKSQRFICDNTRNKTPLQANFKSRNSSFLDKYKDLTMSIYGTGIKNRSKSKSKVFRKSDNFYNHNTTKNSKAENKVCSYPNRAKKLKIGSRHSNFRCTILNKNKSKEVSLERKTECKNISLKSFKHLKSTVSSRNFEDPSNRESLGEDNFRIVRNLQPKNLEVIHETRKMVHHSSAELMDTVLNLQDQISNLKPVENQCCTLDSTHNFEIGESISTLCNKLNTNYCAVEHCELLPNYKPSNFPLKPSKYEIKWISPCLSVTKADNCLPKLEKFQF